MQTLIPALKRISSYMLLLLRVNVVYVSTILCHVAAS